MKNTIRVSYYDLKNHFNNAKTVNGSYDAATKTIEIANFPYTADADDEAFLLTTYAREITRPIEEIKAESDMTESEIAEMIGEIEGILIQHLGKGWKEIKKYA